MTATSVVPKLDRKKETAEGGSKSDGLIHERLQVKDRLVMHAIIVADKRCTHLPRVSHKDYYEYFVP